MQARTSWSLRRSGIVVQDLGGGNEREREPGRAFPRGALPGDIIDPAMPRHDGIEAIPEGFLESAEPGVPQRGFTGSLGQSATSPRALSATSVHETEQCPLGVPEVAAREEAAQVAIPRPVLGQQHHGGAVIDRDLGSGDEPDPCTRRAASNARTIP